MDNNKQYQPSHPRPPSAEIDQVYPDLARVMSKAVKDADGRRVIELDVLREQLESSNHSLAAIEWAVHLLCADNLLHRTIVQEKQVTTTRSYLNEAKPRTIDVPAIAASDDLWVRWEAGKFSPRQHEVILLVHGIRTFAVWHPMVKRVLETIPSTKVVPIKYGYLDALRFWCPWFTRQGAIDDVRREIQKAKAANPDSRLSIIAHSFGTYAVSRILADTPDIKLYKLVLAGSIIPRSYRWDHVSKQLASEVINEYGTRDIWPVLAKCLSWGYGDTGRHGFGRTYVTDRGHDYGHSDFFNEDFVQEYWKPWFESDTIATSPSAERARPSHWLLNILSCIPLQWILLVVMVTALGVIWANFTPTWLRNSQGDSKAAVVDVTKIRDLDDAAIGVTDLIGKEFLESSGVTRMQMCSSPEKLPFGPGIHGRCEILLSETNATLAIHDIYVEVRDTYRAPKFHYVIGPPSVSEPIEVTFMLSDFRDPLPAIVRPRIVQVRGDNKTVASAFPLLLAGGRASRLRLRFMSATPTIYEFQAFAKVTVVGSDGDPSIVDLSDVLTVSFFNSECEFENPMSPGNWYVPQFKEISEDEKAPVDNAKSGS